MQFRDKTIFITGGGSGIGAATCRAFAAAGARVAVADLNLDNAAAVVRDITTAGGQALAIKVDVSSQDSVNAAFDAAEEWYGKATNVLVNSAGIMGVGSFIDYPLKQWESVLGVNLTGTFLCSQRAAQSMVEAKFGRIINVGSVSASRAGIGRVAYGTSKAAILGLTRQLAMELASHGITANVVAPGPILTPFTAASYTPETIAAYESMIPARRMGVVEEISDAILFLASDAARFINGVSVPVDGGYLAGGVNKTGTLGTT